jgi:hypothetical protein
MISLSFGLESNVVHNGVCGFAIDGRGLRFLVLQEAGAELV